MGKRSDETEPTVEIFGDSVKDNGRGDDNGNVVWGMMVLASGVLLLLNTLGIVPWAVWNAVWQFWPVLLVLFGVQMMLGNGFFARLILFVLSFAAFGLVFLYALQSVGSTIIPASILPPPVTSSLEMMRRYAL